MTSRTRKTIICANIISRLSRGFKHPGAGLVAAAALVWLALAGAVMAQDRPVAAPADKDVVVGYHISPPFVMRDADGNLQGMAVDLWNEVAGELGYTATYRDYPTVAGLLEATRNSDIDIAVGNISITEDRATLIDFTQPWFDAGLRVMIDKEGTTGLGDVWEGLWDAGYVEAYGWIVALIILSTIGLTLFDRRFDKNFPPRWRDGFSESFYAVMLVATKGTLPSRTKLFGWIGRIFSAFWLIIGVAVLAYVTSSVTSVMTSLAIKGDIRGPEDLPGRTVGVFAGSISENIMAGEGIDIRAFEGIDQAVAALKENDVDAIVADAPVLEYYKHEHPDIGLDVVGRIFNPGKYGFALPYSQEARTQEVTIKLLALQESGELDALEKQYFGDER
ncbi:transporter substrate-binding domain-containing protein [Hoeflea ulvae]|uniref:Transporter substrate-binding domain-containing protein n=1 Tax=Hoeflea ulvae TaxID=2983764 RepID=A0ABT3YE31_9HYPH|nr:transporter substrate-binding domain-containing protein [Hoeflea ulvae]MCY0094145.1 transporter substrate-binding domain-containing protein [Hoeflea ulvae]